MTAILVIALAIGVFVVFVALGLLWAAARASEDEGSDGEDWCGPMQARLDRQVVERAEDLTREAAGTGR
jgi:hypothetical protein